MDNPEKFKEINKANNLNNLFDISRHEQIIINSKYLLNENILNDTNDILTNNINKFYNEDIKSLIIKSPSGTGKTQLLKEYFNKYKRVRILWLSYRITYSDDILNEFLLLGLKAT